jgi:hypothetical protein
MVNDQKKLGVLFLLTVATIFGLFFGFFSGVSMEVQVVTLVVLAACIILAHYLISRRMNQQKYKPVEVLIILFATITFGMFIGIIMGGKDPFLKIVTAFILAICGFITVYILYLKNGESEGKGSKQ